MATLYDSLGKVEEAKVLYEKALSLEPGNEMARNNYGVFRATHHLSGGSKLLIDSWVIGKNTISARNIVNAIEIGKGENINREIIE